MGAVQFKWYILNLGGNPSTISPTNSERTRIDGCLKSHQHHEKIGPWVDIEQHLLYRMANKLFARSRELHSVKQYPVMKLRLYVAKRGAASFVDIKEKEDERFKKILGYDFTS